MTDHFVCIHASIVSVSASLKYQSFNLVEYNFPFHKFLRPSVMIYMHFQYLSYYVILKKCIVPSNSLLSKEAS